MGSTDGIVILAESGYAAEVASICAALGLPVRAIAGTGSALAAATALGLEAISWTGDIAALPPGPVAITGGDGAERHTLRVRLADADRHATTLIHPDATVGLAVEFGIGCIVSPGARITSNAVVGPGTLINTGAILSHDDRVGRDVTISPSVTICGGVTINDRGVDRCRRDNPAWHQHRDRVHRRRRSRGDEGCPRWYHRCRGTSETALAGQPKTSIHPWNHLGDKKFERRHRLSVIERTPAARDHRVVDRRVRGDC